MGRWTSARLPDHAAVYGDEDAAHVVREVGAQELDHLGAVLYLAVAAQGDVAGRFIVLTASPGQLHDAGGLDDPGRDAVGVDAEGAKLLGEEARVVGDGRLVGAVVGVAAPGAGHQGGHGRDRDDLAGPLLLHDRRDGAATVDGAVEVHAGHQLQQVLGHQGGGGVAWAAAPAAGVGDQDVDPAPGLGHVVDHGEDGVAVGYVELEAQGIAAAGLDLVHRAVGGHRLRLILELGVGLQVEIGDRDLGAKAGQAAGIGPAQPARAAGDDRDLPIEIAHRPSSSSVLASPDLSGFEMTLLGRRPNVMGEGRDHLFGEEAHGRLALLDAARPPEVAHQVRTAEEV